MQPIRFGIMSMDPYFHKEINHFLIMNSDNYSTFPRTLNHYGAFSIDVWIAMGSVGAFTALYKVICKYLERNNENELTIMNGDVKITIKAHSLPEESALIRKLFPEELEKTKDSNIEKDST